MNTRRLTLIEVLQPQCFKTTPERSRVTRTVVQPEIDSFEQMEAQAGRRSDTAPPPASLQLAPQLVGA
ncbi:MAG: hypothetical protein Q8L93_02750 [Rhodocyclaceae bacterium]|nr:hypothetical protein [Rhodocyclaceae bacterium]